MHLLGAQGRLGLAVCTSLGLVDRCSFVCFSQYCGAEDCPCCFAPQYALHWGQAPDRCYVFVCLLDFGNMYCGIGDSPCCFAPLYGYLYMFQYTKPMIMYYIFAPFAPLSLGSNFCLVSSCEESCSKKKNGKSCQEGRSRE